MRGHFFNFLGSSVKLIAENYNAATVVKQREYLSSFFNRSQIVVGQSYILFPVREGEGWGGGGVITNGTISVFLIKGSLELLMQLKCNHIIKEYFPTLLVHLFD